MNSSPGVAVQRQQILQAEFGEQIAAGEFDFALFSKVWSNLSTVPQVTPITTVGRTLDVIKQDTNGVTVGGVQKLRNGVTVSPSATVVRSRANTDPWSAEGRSDMRLQISVPLMRGWGRDAANVNERLAQSVLVATRDVARHNVAERVSQTTLAYWSTLASVQNLEILRESEQRALELSDQLQDMVRVGEIEAAILEEARADLLRRRGDVEGAALALAVNWQRLAASMGLRPEEMGPAPELAGGFPAEPATLTWDGATKRWLVGQALAERGDFRAVTQVEQTNDIYLRNALNDLRSALDLEVRAGYSGLTTESAKLGLFSALSEQLAGPAGEIALEFE
ncbi:MAG: TolC family protein [Candidatus Synoicihabitans palmerolidicus]|nr:TolC family protein [Candidatus Synoicihabitans palmerolidicus]